MDARCTPSQGSPVSAETLAGYAREAELACNPSARRTLRVWHDPATEPPAPLDPYARVVRTVGLRTPKQGETVA